MKQYIFIAILTVFIFAQNAIAQSNKTEHNVDVVIPEVALLGVVEENNIPGNSSQTSVIELNQNSLDSKFWINYSSIVSQSKKRKLVAMVDKQLPKGLQIKINTSEAKGGAKGDTGKTTGEIFLSAQPKDVLTNIGSCFTGAGANNGHSLTYQVETNEEFEENEQLAMMNETYNIIFTLTDSY